ncbi:response regulator transcription factor [Mycobacterium sp. PS03-16]|uniref:LuxR C-terminal-related transcriptional regulator n=1 Tax=Mycobacterium sp. PS03-16 TaxID=2559611 RepID=UPI001073B243|nr:response regulator transcription factor [Mycobacterium sp. PS03-16]TFV59936.1 response regulator transcription factor [Mycobacterium sp. PS03-16]
MAHPAHGADQGRRHEITSFRLDGARREGNVASIPSALLRPSTSSKAFLTRANYRYTDEILTETAVQQSVGPCDGEGELAAINILIVDDCTLQRENLAAVFRAYAGTTPAVAGDLQSLCAALSASPPDVALVNMGSREKTNLVRLVREACPDTKVIVVGISEDDEPDIVACAEAGVDGYHLRAESLEDLFALMARVARGESSCSPKVSAILLRRLSALAAQRKPETKELVLTAREIQILRLLESGFSNRDIADHLCIALHTVKNHVHSLLGKLGVSTRAEAAAYVRRSGIPI